MKERPILFSAPMVRAILEGRKTQTRRVVKFNDAWRVRRGGKQWHLDDPAAKQACPYGQPGDRLWVRESFCDARRAAAGRVLYRATGDVACGWNPSIHMPRDASRINLEVTGVRVERLQDISESAAKAEGCAPSWLDADDNETVHAHLMPTYKQGFARLWRDINGADSWGVNPWVWVVEFRRVEVRA